MTFDIVEKLINKGFSTLKIANELQVGKASVRKFLIAKNLKTKTLRDNFDHEKAFENQMFCLPWNEINQEFSKGAKAKEIERKYKIRRPVWICARDCGMLNCLSGGTSFKIRSMLGLVSRHPVSDETKQKIRIARINYLKTNPHNWENKNKKNSIPCEQLKEHLRYKGIIFIEEYQPLLHKDRFFSIDIAFPDKKIGIEVNGRQHYNADGSLAAYYQDRHDLIEAEGWKLYEIPYNKVYRGIEQILENILSSPDKVKFDFENFKSSNEKLSKENLEKLNDIMLVKDMAIKLEVSEGTILKYFKVYGLRSKFKNILNKNPRPNLRKVERPGKNELENLINNFPFTKIGEKFGVSDNAIRKWCKEYGINTKPYGRGYWKKKYHGKI